MAISVAEVESAYNLVSLAALVVFVFCLSKKDSYLLDRLVFSLFLFFVFCFFVLF